MHFRKGKYLTPTSALGGDGDLGAWIAAVNAGGGSVSGARATIVGNFISAEKAAGTWALTDDYWPLWGENSTQALISLKQRRTATATNSPTFTTDRGYTFDGATNYVNTGFIASTHAVAMTGTNMRVAVYERTNVSTNTQAIGVSDGSTYLMRLTPRQADTALTGQVQGNLPSPQGVADSLGFSSIACTPTPTLNTYKRGVVSASGAYTQSFNTLPSLAVFIGGRNASGVLTLPRASEIGFACVGASLSTAQELAQYNNVQTWATAIGANV